LDAHLQKILQGVEYFKTQLKKRMAEIEELHRTVNDMDKVSFYYAVSQLLRNTCYGTWKLVVINSV